MYSPDGFASLACALHDQCFFLGWQQPFIELMRLINKNIYLFFGLQALLWFALIGLTYFLTKELKCKHLFLTPFILLFSGTFFVYNFVGSLENDAFGIILLLISFIYYLRYKKHKHYSFLLVSITSFITSFAYWMWPGYLIRLPVLISPIAEVMIWVNWLSWSFLFFGILFILVYGLKTNNKYLVFISMFVLLIPKLFIFIVPTLLIFIDKFVSFIYTKKNYKFLYTIIIVSLILGQGISVGLNTNQSWNREIENEQCVLVNDEYFLRATKGLNYSYNQLSIKEQDSCKHKT